MYSGNGNLRTSSQSQHDELIIGEDLSVGSLGFEITVIQAGNGKLYSDKTDYFYRIEKHYSSEDDLKISNVRCTFENCKGTGVIYRKGDIIKLIHKNPHSCEPNSYFLNIIALKKKILYRCKNDRRKSLRTIFQEETSSNHLSPAVCASLSYSTLLPTMMKTRDIDSWALNSITTENSISDITLESYTTEQPTGTVAQFVYINEDGVIEDEEFITVDHIIKELSGNDEGSLEIATFENISNTDNPSSANSTLGPGMPALEIPAKRGRGALFTDGNSYFYHKRRHVVLNGDIDTWYMSCVQDNCQGRGIMQLRDDSLVLYHRLPHSCGPTPALITVMDMKNRIMERCKIDHVTPLRDIFVEETLTSNFPSELRDLLPYRSIESDMWKARRELIKSKKQCCV